MPVSIVKAGMSVIGRDAGPVRTPLTDLTDGERAELKALIDRAQGKDRPIRPSSRGARR